MQISYQIIIFLTVLIRLHVINVFELKDILTILRNQTISFGL